MTRRGLPHRLQHLEATLAQRQRSRPSQLTAAQVACRILVLLGRAAMRKGDSRAVQRLQAILQDIEQTRDTAEQYGLAVSFLACLPRSEYGGDMHPVLRQRRLDAARERWGICEG